MLEETICEWLLDSIQELKSKDTDDETERITKRLNVVKEIITDSLEGKQY